jgi:RNA polymerase sigma-70 factor, ECF subfamily
MKASPEDNDLALIDGMKRNRHDAYEALYHKYATQLYVFTAHKLHAKEVAEELVHDVFIRLWEKRSVLNIQTNVAAYLFKMMRNEILQYLRSTKNREAFIDEMLALDIKGETQTDENLFYKEMAVRLQEIIDNLPDKCREIFILSRENDLSVKEIASRLDIADQTVKNQLTKALTIVRKELKHITYLFF